MTSSQPLVAADGVSVSYGSGLVVQRASLSVLPGQVVAVLGANGSGKSTLIKAIVGVNPIAEGEVRLLGASSVSARRRAAARVGYVPQRLSSTAGIAASSLEVVQSGLTGPGLFRARRSRERAMAALKMVRMDDFATRSVATLSGGQHQRVLIARALIRQPHLLVMDEPLAGIDADSAESLAQILGERKREGVGVLLVLHDLGPLRPLIDNVLVLEGGRPVFWGASSEYLSRVDLAELPRELCSENLSEY